MFKTIVFAFVILTLASSCVTKVFPDEKMVIDPSFLSLFNSIIQKDTIRFTNPIRKNKTFVISNVDSVLTNEKGGLMDQMPYKMLRANFREIDNDTLPLDRENIIFVDRDPTRNENSIVIQFNNFYKHDSVLQKIHYDTLNLNTKKFSGYYSFESELESKKAGDVRFLFISRSNGFIGFKTLSGEVWVRE